MIITATAGNAGIGRDITIGVTNNDGVTYTINGITEIEYRAVTLDITRTLINASTIIADLPRMWEGSITFVRSDSAVDQATWNVETAWLTQGPADFTLGNMVVNIRSPAGFGNATLTFQDVSFRLEDGGTWKADDVTICKLSFRAGRRQVGA
jgi:hypothetical protein